MKTKGHHIIITKGESVATSWARDMSVLALFLGLVGFGVWMDSVVLEVAGLFVAIVITVSWSNRSSNRYGTPEEAIEYLKGLK